jgi:alpha-D-xyloside xylohydrolase
MNIKNLITNLMKKKSIILFFSILALFSCHNKPEYKKLDDGVIISLSNNNTKTLKIQVINDKIIRVIATADDSVKNKKSLIVLNNIKKQVNWNLKETKDTLSISTNSLNVAISLKTGSITYKDKEGNIIVKESEKGKYFKKFNDNGKKYYQIRQMFESADDEAIYGLGQQQDDILNYKGKDVDLYQYNTKVSLPFFISNRMYGILWDNYSRSKFGDIREFESISGLKLYDEKGHSGGLTAIYQSQSDSNNIYLKRTENDIDYEFIPSLSKIPKEFKIFEGKTIWTGFVGSKFSGVHKFRIYASGYIKVWINNQLLLSRWRQSWNPTPNILYFNIEKNKKYPIRIEWIPDGNEAYIGVRYLPPIPENEQKQISLYSEYADAIDYYFIAGKNFDEIISGYREITGKAPIMPKWAMGLWQSRQRYKTQDELINVVKEYRKRNIPLDNIVLDWQYWKIDQWGSHEFDSSRFPNPTKMISDLHNMNSHIMISVWPKFYTGTKNYEEMNNKGYLYKKNIEDARKDWMGYVHTFYDAFNPEARKLFWQRIDERLYKLGIDAWWMDASEPDMHSNLPMEIRKLLMNPTYLGPGAEYFNAYPLVNSQSIYEGQREENPDQRVFILTRSAFPGQQRYAAATWSGDIASRWEELKRQIPAGTNFSMSGIPYWTMDIGGFSVEKRYENPTKENAAEWKELLTRWIQFGSFCPLFRLHGEYPYREIYNIASQNDEEYNIMVKYDKLRYKLMPYIYSLAGLTYIDNYTIMRGLVMDFANDKNVLNITDQFMFGPSIMVCPVYQYKARNRQVYLPSGYKWYNLITGKVEEGGKTIVAEAPLSDIPLFVKEGSIIPCGPEIQYAMQKADPITLYIYSGKDAEFNLYEDENTNYNYEKGSYSIIPVKYSENEKKIIIGQRKGEFAGMLKTRKFKIIVIAADKPISIFSIPNICKEITYNGNEQIIKL